MMTDQQIINLIKELPVSIALIFLLWKGANTLDKLVLLLSVEVKTFLTGYLKIQRRRLELLEELHRLGDKNRTSEF